LYVCVVDGGDGGLDVGSLVVVITGTDVGTDVVVGGVNVGLEDRILISVILLLSMSGLMLERWSVSTQELDVEVAVVDGVDVGLDVGSLVVVITGTDVGMDVVVGGVDVGLKVGIPISVLLLASMSGLKSERWSVSTEEHGVDDGVVVGVDIGLDVGSMVGVNTGSWRWLVCLCR